MEFKNIFFITDSRSGRWPCDGERLSDEDESSLRGANCDRRMDSPQFGQIQNSESISKFKVQSLKVETILGFQHSRNIDFPF